MFLVFFGFFQKNPIVFFGFSRFLVLENLENPKNTMWFFGFFRFLLKNPKNTMIFLAFSIKTTENPKTTIVFLDFQEFPKAKTLKIQKKTIGVFEIFR